MQEHDQTKSTVSGACLLAVSPEARDLEREASSKPDANLPERSLLGDGDQPAVSIVHGQGESPFVLVLDHAGRAVPSLLGDLGLSDEDRRRHIAWDIGVAGTGAKLRQALDATAVSQTYSRLVIDCNRRPGHPTSIAPRSDATDIPGNQHLSPSDRRAREREIFAPYHDGIAQLLDQRAASGRQTVLVALHSFTPRLASAPPQDGPAGGPERPSAAGSPDGERPWHAGVLYNHDPRFSLILFDLLREEGDLEVGDNEPYALSDLDDYTVPVHGEQRGLPHVEIEIRQDLIADPAGEAAWAARLARLLPEAWTRYRAMP